ncbi:MAG: hypothetical protein NTW97_02160 [Candidatus Krumholzibacteria bacterium]|nr:hypothetical protein [Candidatus Krumholzibacteria bacterium]
MSDTDRAVVLRILDANANRCAEGLRVVEEIARFSMRNAPLTASLKDLRHEVRRGVEALAEGALQHRDSVGDVARGSATASELARGSLAAVARANFARAEEALRVLEEFGKLIDEKESGRFKSLRFALYAIERGYFAEATGAARIPPPPFLYAILDRSVVGSGNVAFAAGALVSAGVGMIQYRAKPAGEAEKRRDIVAILEAARAMYRERIDLHGQGVRLLGVGVSALVRAGSAPGSLFPDPATERARKLTEAQDAVNDKLGEDVITRASLLRRKSREASSLPTVD